MASRIAKCAANVGSVSEFIDSVLQIRRGFKALGNADGEEVWYRGVSDRTYELLPGAYRSGNACFHESTALDMFRAGSHGYVSSIGTPSDDWEWYFLMQHYGIPTRLLDWSEQPLVALFFAIEGEIQRQERAKEWGAKADLRIPAVWLMDAGSLNHTSTGLDRIYGTVSAGAFVRHWLHSRRDEIQKNLHHVGDVVTTASNKWPIAIRPARASPRIIAQSGMFTIHGARATPIEQLFRHAQPLHRRIARIDVKGAKVGSVWQELQDLGIVRHSLFPELHEFGAHVRKQSTFARTLT